MRLYLLPLLVWYKKGGLGVFFINNGIKHEILLQLSCSMFLKAFFSVHVRKERSKQHSLVYFKANKYILRSSFVAKGRVLPRYWVDKAYLKRMQGINPLGESWGKLR